MEHLVQSLAHGKYSVDIHKYYNHFKQTFVAYIGCVKDNYCVV